MVKVIELLRQGKHEEIWQMCCGYLNLDIEQFMAVQRRLMLGQLESLNKSRLGWKVMGGARPQTVEEFRQEVPLTTYNAYCPELPGKNEGILPEKVSQWVHTSGRSGEYSRKWIPMSSRFVQELGPILAGLGLLSASRKWGDIRPFTACPNMIYTVAPRPYVSGALASILQEQTPSHYFPSLAEAENMSFEDRIQLGFEEALSEGLDYFFGLSLVLSAVGEKFSQSTKKLQILPLVSHPRVFLRLTRGIIKSRMAHRTLLPKDLWKIRGIISSIAQYHCINDIAYMANGEFFFQWGES